MAASSISLLRSRSGSSSASSSPISSTGSMYNLDYHPNKTTTARTIPTTKIIKLAGLVLAALVVLLFVGRQSGVDKVWKSKQMQDWINEDSRESCDDESLTTGRRNVDFWDYTLTNTGE